MAINELSTLEQAEIQNNIAQIIERSRRNEEAFLIDTKSAASGIIGYLQEIKLITSISIPA